MLKSLFGRFKLRERSVLGHKRAIVLQEREKWYDRRLGHTDSSCQVYKRSGVLISALGIDKIFSPILKYTQNRASSEWSLRLAGAEKRLEERRRPMLSLAIRSSFSASCPNLRALSRSPPLCADVRD